MSGIIAQNTLDNTGLIKAPEGGGAWTFIKKLTASSSADLSFVDGSADVVLDSTYKIYLFYYVNMHPATDDVEFQFNGSTDSGSNYNVTNTSTVFTANHNEAGDGYQLAYKTDRDTAQSTGFLNAGMSKGNDNDQSSVGYLYVFNPSSTTFVKHFIMRNQSYGASNYARSGFTAGYWNTTSAVDAVQFKMSSGNIDAGSIFLHGLTI